MGEFSLVLAVRLLEADHLTALDRATIALDGGSLVGGKL